ncbi:dihydrofolate reductase [Pseudoxanthobacter sp.]|uniref:dihydrofolate reductase n=1 Tax=Pseudoxanthobacter sp. TaxID=1925742 RepID=UPI002FE396DF
MIPQLVLVAAVAENGVIGTGEAMPWHLPSDLKRFRDETWGYPMLMGRRTFRSIGRALPGRDSVVVTSDDSFFVPGVHRAVSVDDGLEIAARLAAARGVNAIMVIGGGDLYRALIGRADRLSITEVHARPEGSVFFPPIDRHLWQVVRRGETVTDPRDSAPTAHVVYERRRDG